MTDKFWNLIDDAREKSGGDLDKLYEVLFDSLLELPMVELMLWARILRQYYHYACQSSLFSVSQKVLGDLGDQGFRGFRGWLIAQGPAVYFASLDDSKIAGAAAAADKNQEAEFEELEMLPVHVFMRKANLSIFNYSAYQKEYDKYKLPVEAVKKMLHYKGRTVKKSGWQLVAPRLSEDQYAVYS